jgi:uncharacterized repeat protein (TIGR01451 family)
MAQAEMSEERIWKKRLILLVAGAAIVASFAVSSAGSGVPPTAVDDTTATQKNVSLSGIDVLSNDSDPEADSLVVTAADNPTSQGGATAINPDSSIQYSPPLDFVGTDTFTYTVSDGTGTATATVSVMVTDVVLGVLKSGTPAIVNAGEQVTYTVVVTNSGTTDATTVTMTDPLPSGFSASSVAPTPECSGTTTTVCDLGTVAAGASVTVTIVADVDPGLEAETANNQATVTSAQTSSPVTASATTAVTESAGLDLSKTGPSGTVTAGDLVTYTVKVGSTGPSDVDNVVVTDTVDPGLTLVSVSPGPECSFSSPTAVCNFSNIAPGVASQKTITVIAMVSPSLVGGSAITNTVAATSDEGAAGPVQVTNVVDESAALSLGKVSTPGAILAGESVTYTLTVQNGGPSDADNVGVTDTLPSTDFTVSSASASQGSCGVVTQTVSCGLGVLGPGSNATVTIVAAANSSTPTRTYTDSATADSDEAIRAVTATADTVVGAGAYLSIVKTDSPDPVTAGELVTYTLTVANAGPSDAEGVSVTDTVPSGTTFVSATGGVTPTAGVLTWNLGAIAASAPPTTLTVVVRVDSSTTSNLSNTAAVSSQTNDPNPANNTAAQSTAVVTSADLQLTKTDSPDPVVAGRQVTYTLTVSTAGPSDALGVSVADTLPAGTTFVSASNGGAFASGVVTWNLGTIAAGSAPVTRTLVVLVNPSTTSSLSNTATVSSSTSDPNPANNSATEATAVNTSADLSIVKTDSPDPVVAGHQVTYTLSVANAGPSDALNVAVADTIPAGTTFSSASNGGTYASGVVTWSLGSIAASAPPVSVTLVVNVDTSTASSLSNTATVSSSVSDPNPANNSATEATAVNTSADLSIVKTDSPDPVVAGHQVTYTLSVANAGPSDALNVAVDDILPVGVTYASDTDGCLVGATVSCGLGTVAASQTKSFEIVVDVTKLPDQTVVTNTATATSKSSPMTPATPDPNSGNNAAQQSTSVIAPVLTLVKTANPADGSDIGPGRQITYTISYSNSSTQGSATNFVITDTVSALLSVPTPTGGGTFDPDTRVITWSLGTLAPGVTGTVVYSTAAGATDRNQDVTNQAFAMADEIPAPVASNTTVHHLIRPDVSITKTSSPVKGSEVKAFQVITYTLVVTNNNATTRALGVTVRDVLPAYLNYVSGSTTLDGVAVADVAGTSPLFPPTSNLSLGDLARRNQPGSTRTITFQVAVDPTAKAGTILENWAYAKFNLGNNEVGDFNDLRVLRPQSPPMLRQSILVQSPTGETIFVTVLSAVVKLLPITGLESLMIAVLALSIFGIGWSLSTRPIEDDQ